MPYGHNIRVSLKCGVIYCRDFEIDHILLDYIVVKSKNLTQY